MSGPGELDAGDGLAGADWVAEPSAASGAQPPVALSYSAGDFGIDNGGAYESIHPVDQRVRLALLTKRGSIPAAEEIGFDWTTPFQWGERLTADVTDRIRNALFRSDVTSADVEEVRIVVSSPVRGRVKWIYVYRNRRTGAEVSVNG